MKRTLSVFAAFAALGGAAPFADPVGEAFTRIDTSEDGAISQAEFVAYQKLYGGVSERVARQQFGQLSGPDGLISIEEFRAGPQRATNTRPRPAQQRRAPPPRRPQRGYGS